MDLYRFLRISTEQRRISISEFRKTLDRVYESLLRLHENGKIFLSDELLCGDAEQWMKQGVKTLGLFHGTKTAYIDGELIGSEDMGLLYYYRNRLTGYELGLKGKQGRVRDLRGGTDEFGFLA